MTMVLQEHDVNESMTKKRFKNNENNSNNNKMYNTVQ